MHMLHEALRPLGYGIAVTSEYWLPDADSVRTLDCGYELRVLGQKDFSELVQKLPQIIQVIIHTKHYISQSQICLTL